jgi:gamma-glutamyltranspeptidase/glutathione hydrolase
MADWRATYEKPAHYRFHNYDLFKPSSWSQGPAFLQMMALLRDSDILGCDPLGAAFVHQIIEATKLAFADREDWYGESSQTPCPIEILLSEDYNKARRKLIGDTAAAHVEPGHPNDRVPKMPKFVIGSARQRSEAPRSELPAKVDGDTCHIDVIDRWGNVVAATPSGGWLQGSPVIPELGMTLNTRAQMLWVQPGLPSSLAPRVRPRTTLSPTMAFRSDGYRLAFGSRGADHQDQWIAEFFLRHIGSGFDLQAAVDAPMFQTDHWPKSEFPRNAYPRRVTLDHTYEPAVVKSLEEAGHAIHFDGQRKWGRNCAAAKDGALLLAAGSSSVRQTFAAGR